VRAGAVRDRLRDYALFDAVVEAIGAAYCIDLDRVFVVGHSLGGSFANGLGCDRGSVIRGVGTVAGRVWVAPCSGPAGAMILHNPKDDLVPFERGLEARDIYPHLWPRDAGRAIMEFFESLPPAVATGWRESDSDASTSRVLSRLDHEHGEETVTVPPHVAGGVAALGLVLVLAGRKK
jgi:pimeloyl-ACP methyl ester carboxylesterase